MTMNETRKDKHANHLLLSTVGELVARQPARARLFEKLGMDYCCGGNIPLAAACDAQGHDTNMVLAMLEGLDLASGEPGEPELLSLDAGQLSEHITERHHEWLRQELPRLGGLLQKCQKHVQSWPWLEEFSEVFDRLQIELAAHLDHEEQLLFPAIRRLESIGSAPAGHAPMLELLNRLEREHEETGQALERLRELSDCYEPPQGCCNTMRAMLAAFAELEQDTHRHVHKENSVLFPAVRRMCTVPGEREA